MPANHPTVTAILLSHNCVDFVSAAAESLLAQDCDPMEVVISDDASQDGTFAQLRRQVDDYHGPHRVTLRQRQANSGSKSAHLNDVIPRTSGEVLVSFDDDDISEPCRIRRILEAFSLDPGVQAVYSSYTLIDEHDHRIGRGRVPHPAPEEDPSRWFSRVDAYASGATLAIRRAVFEEFGPMDPKVHEDIILPFRASLLGEVHFIDEPLIRARRWAGSLTADRDRFDSIETHRARMLQGIRQAERNLQSRLSDLATATHLMPHRAPEWDELRQLALGSMTNAEITADLVSPSLLVRVRCFLKLVRSGAYRDEMLQNAGLAFFPNLYLAYKRRQLRKQPTVDGPTRLA